MAIPPGPGKTALITGITGQDGIFLRRLLLAQGYDVHGLTRDRSTLPRERAEALAEDEKRFGVRLTIHAAAQTGDAAALLTTLAPDEVYNLAAHSTVRRAQDDALAAERDAARDLDALRQIIAAARSLKNPPRLLQASTSEIFGVAAVSPQNEETPIAPSHAPYAQAKAEAHRLIQQARAYGLYAVNAILYNHESRFRGANFVSRVIAAGVADIALGRAPRLTLQNVDGQRDWGHAADYARAMSAMLSVRTPEDYVLASGQTRWVRDFVTAAFAAAGVQLAWRGAGRDEKAHDAHSGALRVEVQGVAGASNPAAAPCGDASKARAQLGWAPQISFEDMVREMVDAERAARAR